MSRKTPASGAEDFPRRRYEERRYEGPTGVTLYRPDRCYVGYTLFSQAMGDTEYLIDMRGVVVHTWRVSHSQLGELLPNGHLLYDDYGRGVYELDWDGNPVWRWEGHEHHDFHRYGNGNTLILVRRPAVAPQVCPEGEVWDDHVIEVTPRNEVVWEWHLVEHTEELSELGGVTFPRPRRPGRPGPFDWAHTNSIEPLPDTPLGRVDRRFRAGNILFSCRPLDTVGVVDRETGRVVWAWGKGTLDKQHMPTMLPSGNILIFDNGTTRGYSSVVELNPATGEVVWDYTDPEGFYSPARAGAERLPNGNTLICEADTGRLFEVTPEKEIVWDYHTPFRAGPPGGQMRHIYRAERYPLEYVERFLAPVYHYRPPAERRSWRTVVEG